MAEVVAMSDYYYAEVGPVKESIPRDPFNAHLSPDGYNEAVNALAYEHRCPRCKAEMDKPCMDQRREGKANKHPHEERRHLVPFADVWRFFRERY